MAELDLKGSLSKEFRERLNKRFKRTKPNSKDRYLLRQLRVRIKNLAFAELGDVMIKHLWEEMRKEGIARRIMPVQQVTSIPHHIMKLGVP
jgi:hypothetical protein